MKKFVEINGQTIMFKRCERQKSEKYSFFSMKIKAITRILLREEINIGSEKMLQKYCVI